MMQRIFFPNYVNIRPFVIHVWLCWNVLNSHYPSVRSIVLSFHCRPTKQTLNARNFTEGEHNFMTFTKTDRQATWSWIGLRYIYTIISIKIVRTKGVTQDRDDLFSNNVRIMSCKKKAWVSFNKKWLLVWIHLTLIELNE